jgi:hypothetical protein
VPRWMDPPGNPWRLPLIVLGIPVAIVVLVELVDLTKIVAAWAPLFR